MLCLRLKLGLAVVDFVKNPRAQGTLTSSTTVKFNADKALEDVLLIRVHHGAFFLGHWDRGLGTGDDGFDDMRSW